MKLFSFLAVAFLCGAAVFAESPALAGESETSAPPKASVGNGEISPLFSWSMLWSGSWEESASTSLSGTLHNRGEIRINILPLGLSLRGGVLDRRTLRFKLDQPFGDPEKWITNFTGGLYHKPTGSRLLFGVLDEWGLSARIRSPWIRSPPYTENHKPLIADIKTTASSTKEDEVYLYLSSPLLEIFPNVKMRGFVSAQTETEEFKPAFSSGLDFTFAGKKGLLLEVFYTGAELAPTKQSTWFSDPPSLPEREFRLYAAGLLFTSPNFSISSDFAFSETFAWGADIYGNLGVSLTPLLPFGSRARPLTVSLAVDGAGERFIYRDGVNHGPGFRSAAKIEWKGVRNSLLRLNTVLRGPGFGEDFNRSSTGFYYRFPAAAKNRDGFPVSLTRISLTVDRNAVNPQKISDGLSGYVGFSINLQPIAINSPLGVVFSGSVDWLAAMENPPPYPLSGETRHFDAAGTSCELSWSPWHFQFRSKLGYTVYAKKDEKWDFSLSAAIRFKNGRLSLKAASSDFPKKWRWTVSWRLERREKR